jgi:predicted transcriptional regulator
LDRGSWLIKLIEQNPGIHQAKLERKSGLEHGVLNHYLDKLEKQGVIKSQKSDKYRRYYLPEVKEDELCIMRNIKKKSKKDLLITIITHGSPTFRELVENVGKSPSTISWNITGLIKDGIIEKCKINEKETYRIKNRELVREFFQKRFPEVFDEKYEHAEDIFLAL